MTNQHEVFTVSISAENHVGLLNRVTSIFLKRHLNIESLTVSESEIPDIHRFTVEVITTEELIQKVVKQLEKQVEVVRAYYHRNDEVFTQEIAMYKIAAEHLYETDCQSIIKANRAYIVGVEKEFFVVEKAGTYAETKKLYDDLAPFGLMQFVRSGRIAITKPKMLISEIIR